MSTFIVESRPWIIFDGDNTLWLSEELYDDAREGLCRFLASKGHELTEVHDFQQARDRELYHSLGYDRSRFTRSLVETLAYFEPNASNRDKEFVADLGAAVFSRPAPPASDSGAVLGRLSEKFNLALLTAGDDVVQHARLCAFPFLGFFRVTQIVKEKNKQTLSEFLAAHGMQSSDTTIIGDSLRSDVLPAVECGLRAVWISNNNWTIVENREFSLPTGVQIVHTLTEFESIMHTF